MWAVLAVIVVVGGATIGFLTWANQSRAEPNDWPPLIMRYNVEVGVNDGVINQVRQLTYIRGPPGLRWWWRPTI